MGKNRSIDMCNGPLLPQIFAYFVPLVLTNILQQLYNSADQIIAGKFAGDSALAAIGATGSLSLVFINILIGVSIGASTIIAQRIGAADSEAVSRSVHTSFSLGIIGGIIFGILGIIFCKPILTFMGTPTNVIDMSVKYMRIIFAGLPFATVFNFNTAVLRAKGDTKRPLIILSFSGAINVVLNVFFVVVFKMDVDGVAFATIISQGISCFLTTRYLILEEYPYRLDIKQTKIHKTECGAILKNGVPNGVRASLFSASNMIIQSAVNSFGSFAMAGVAAASTIDGLLYVILNSLSNAATIFCGQNFGAKKYERILKSIFLCSIMAVGFGLAVGGIGLLFKETLVGIFVNDAQSIKYGAEVVGIIMITYFLCGLMEIGSGALSAINHATNSVVNSIVGLVFIRIVWIFTYFAANRTILNLYLSYPLSWIGTILLHIICFIWHFRKIRKDNQNG